MRSLTFKEAVLLMAPNTLIASVIPVLVAAAICFRENNRISGVLFAGVLVMAMLMQAGANVLNDYYDFCKGTDNEANSTDQKEAILVHNPISLKQVLFFGDALVLTGLVICLLLYFIKGGILFFAGAIGALAVFFYSGGKKPISYLPLGELISGTTMGIVLPLAVYHTLDGKNVAEMILSCIPIAFSIAMIMFTNNLCDIEKDQIAGRKTVAVLLGREKGRGLYQVMLFLWSVSLLGSAYFVFASNTIVLIVLLLVTAMLMIKQSHLSLAASERMNAMKGIMRINIILGIAYIVLILL